MWYNDKGMSTQDELIRPVLDLAHKQQLTA
jgi:hypothetical protein